MRTYFRNSFRTDWISSADFLQVPGLVVTERRRCAVHRLGSDARPDPGTRLLCKIRTHTPAGQRHAQELREPVEIGLVHGLQFPQLDVAGFRTPFSADGCLAANP